MSRVGRDRGAKNLRRKKGELNHHLYWRKADQREKTWEYNEILDPA